MPYIGTLKHQENSYLGWAQRSLSPCPPWLCCRCAGAAQLIFPGRFFHSDCVWLNPELSPAAPPLTCLQLHTRGTESGISYNEAIR